MRYLKFTLLVCVCCFFYVESHAQDRDNPWLLSFGVNSVDNRVPNNFGGMIEDYIGVNDRKGVFGDLNTLPAITAFSVSRYLDKGFSVGIKTSINELSKEFGLDEGNSTSKEVFFAFGAHVKYDVNDLLGETGWFDPFVSLGINYTSIGEDNDYRLGIGYGFNTWFNETIGLTFASDYNHNFDEIGNDYFQHSLGVSFRFGGKDTDGDGVLDNKDLCPNVVGLLEFNGCPDSDGDGIVDADDACPNAAGSIDLQGCPDSDGDGVANVDDACPNTVGSIDLQGCPDSDGDGVLDKDDACARQAGPASNKGCPWPDTDGDGILDKNDKCIDLVGPVSNQGCPELTAEAVKKVVEFKKSISFNSGKASLKPGVAKELDGVVEIMKTFSGVKFTIEGHADSLGSATLNLNLSKARAGTVKEYLISKGIDANRLRAEGFGEDKPIASNKTAKGRELNRRVEVIAEK